MLSVTHKRARPHQVIVNVDFSTSPKNQLNVMKSKPISRRTLLKGLGSVAIGLPFLEEMLVAKATTTARPDIPVRAFNVFFGLGIPAPLQREGFDGVLEPLKELSDKLLIMRDIDHVRCDESGINAHFDGASASFTAEPPDGEAKSGGPSIDQVIRNHHYAGGMPPGMVPTLVGGNVFPAQPGEPVRSQLQHGRYRGRYHAGATARLI